MIMLKKITTISLSLLATTLVVSGCKLKQGSSSTQIDEKPSNEEVSLISDSDISDKVFSLPSSVDTSGWAMYENEEYGFTLNYPPEYQVGGSIVDDNGNPRKRIYTDYSEKLGFTWQYGDGQDLGLGIRVIAKKFWNDSFYANEIEREARKPFDQVKIGGDIWIYVNSGRIQYFREGRDYYYLVSTIFHPPFEGLNSNELFQHAAGTFNSIIVSK